MPGIVSFGAYVPRYRMPKMTLYMNMGWFNPVTMSVAKGEKSIANVDQDSITMAVDSALSCLGSEEGKDIDAIYFASTTMPYKERLNAGIISAALDLSSTVRAADFSGGLKAGTSAVISALEAAAAGKKVLVASSDNRLGKPGSMQEMLFGDGAASVLIGDDNVIAEYVDSFSVTYDFADHIRREDAAFDRTWEERWIRDTGYSQIIPEAVQGLLEKTGTKPEEVAKVIYPCHFDRIHGKLLKKAVDPEKVQDNLGTVAGDTGAAHPLLMLSATLESAQPGDKIVLVGYGNGADAILFQVTDAIKDFGRKPYTETMARREELQAYTKYLVFNNIMPVEVGIRGELEAPTAFTALWRDRQSVMGLVGSKCKKCGKLTYPINRVCSNMKCRSVDEWEPELMRNKKARIFTFTADMLAFSFDPPQIYGIIDTDEGGRMQLDFTDCKQEDLKVGDPVEFTFRKKYSDDLRGIVGYNWKAMPIKSEQ